MAFTGEDHGHAELVGARDVLLVSDGTAGLDDHGDTGVGSRLDAVGEGIERVARARTTGGAPRRLRRCDLSGFDAILLTGPDAVRRAVLHEDDGIRLHPPADAPGQF